MEDAPKLLRIPKSECPDIWIRVPRLKWPKSWSNGKDPVIPLKRNLYGHPLAGFFRRRKNKTWMGKSTELGMSFCSQKTKIILIGKCGECKPNEPIIEGYKKMFESRISARATEKLPG